MTAILKGLFLLLFGICLLPAAVMLAGTFWHEGRPSLVHVGAAFAHPARILELFKTSAVVAAGSAALALLFGTPLGFLCFRTDLPFRRAIILGCVVAACVPLYIGATCWMAVTGMHLWLYNAWGAAWITGLAYTPLVTLVTGTAFAASDREVEEATALDAGRRGVFWHASLPAGAWGVAVAAMAVVILSLWDITVTDILMIRTFAEEVFTQFQLGAGPWSAAAVSLPMIAILLVLWAAIGRLVAGRGEGTLWGRVQPPPMVRLGLWRWPLAAATLGAIALCLGLPLGALMRTLGSLHNLATAWRTAEYEIVGTLSVTPVAATVSLALAVPAAWVLVRGRRVLRWLVGAGLLLLVSVPAPVVGIGLIEVLNRPGLPGMIYDSQAGLVLAYVIRALPFVTLALVPAMRSIPREVVESAVLDGAGPWRAFRSVVLPYAWRAMVAGWFFGFVLALADMGASFLVAPPGRATLSTRFFTLIHYGVYPDAAGLCVILMAIVAAGTITVALCVWRGRWRHELA